MVVEREARRRPIANAPRREPGETTPAAHRSRRKAECKRCAARTGEPNPFWERCRPVELSVGELQLDLHIHPTLKIQPEPMVDEP